MDIEKTFMRVMVAHPDTVRALKLSRLKVDVYRQVIAGKRTTTAIADALTMDSSQVVYVMNDLFAKGYVVRRQIPREGVGGVLFEYFGFDE